MSVKKIALSFEYALGLPLFLAALVVGGCDRSEAEPRGGEPSNASRQEVAELEKALADDAKKDLAGKAGNSVPVVQPPKGNQEATKEPQPEPVAKPTPAVVGFSFDRGHFELQFNDQPDLTSLMDYVKVLPNPGPLTQDWWSWRKTCRFCGTFQPRTQYQVVVRPGVPMADGRVTTNEFRRTWRTPDSAKSVNFASAGRYLPAGGRRAVAVKTVNVTNLFCQIRTVPKRNIVQLLAREENSYGRFYGGGGDSEDTEELAGEPISRPLRVKGRLNQEATTALDIRGDDGKAENGVYLVSARDEDGGQVAWKLVCVTDVGLSVREAGGTVYVWATSLTRGTPIAGLRVLVYGSNNVVMGEALTDDEGWCCCDMPENGRPFAVVASKMESEDVSFLALRGELDEESLLGDRREFVKGDGSEAFVWTERGIYRHDEPILVHAILRNGKGNAPKPFPVDITLLDPNGKVFLRRTQVTDACGVVSRSDFSVTDDQPSGWWQILVRTPGDDGFVLGRRTIKIEEFVPPQIRVKVMPPTGTVATTNMMFTVAGEHLFGGPAKGLPAEGAVMFEDAPFAPRGWEAFRFGNENRRLQPNFTTLDIVHTGDDGLARFAVDFPQKARPRAAVKMTVQGSVFEGGGRPASARAMTMLHAYPYYIGVALPDTIRESAKPRACRVVVVNPDGTPHAGTRRLTARFERVESVYGLKKTPSGSWEWRTDKVRYPMGDEVPVEVSASGLATLQVPASSMGDYAVTLVEEETGVSFGASYWVGGAEDAVVRSALENPSRVTLTADRKLYHPGDRPRLTVKAPFAGHAWISVLRDEMLYSQIITLTNATSEIVLEPVKAEWAPGVDVALSVVQAVKPGQRQVANRAFGVVPVLVSTLDSSLDVKVKATAVCAPAGGACVSVDVQATGTGCVGERAVVTLVDEGINLLTDEKVPDPVDWFGASRHADHPLWDIYNRVLPIFGDQLKCAGAKTGGGGEGDLFRRVSPVPTRRFKPLSMWKVDVPLKNGHAVVPFELPEFVGEVRATAVAYNRRATGAGADRAKVSPNLVMQPDAPRFAAPGDTFLATVTLSNRSGKDGVVAYDLMVGGTVSLDRPVHGELKLADGQSETLSFPVKVGAMPGQGTLIFVSEGLGEKHRGEIMLPVRPAAPWMKSVETVRIEPGQSRTFENTAVVLPDAARRTFIASSSPVAELASALEYLVAYPYGCLEQTTSRVFPLIAAGGILNTLPVRETSVAQDAKTAVDSGIRRVCSMIRSNDFVMWPDTTMPPWDRGVSLWASHFLVAAAANGYAVPQDRLARVKGFLRNWAMSTNEAVSVYACHTLALTGTPDRDRMLHWFDRRMALPLLGRARLARAFARAGDPIRARELLSEVHPVGVSDAAFALLALLEIDAADVRIPSLVTALADRRDKVNLHWGTTESNAHALLALGAYYRAVPSESGSPEFRLTVGGREDALVTKQAKRMVGCGNVIVANHGKGAGFVTASTLAVGDPATLQAEAKGIEIARRYFRTDGSEADLTSLVRGEMLVAEITLTAPMKATYSDLVIEDLLPACFEPDHSAISGGVYPWAKQGVRWEMRRELRDDRVLGFSHRFSMEQGASAKFYYAVRVVSAGEFVLPAPSVEAMYDPSLRARGVASRVKIEQ